MTDRILGSPEGAWLRERGLETTTAVLAAEIGIAAFKVA